MKEEGISNEYSGDNSRFINEFGPINFTNINDSVHELFDWYKFKSKLSFDDRLFDNWVKN